jgi:anti-sigma regulatory factor (Ser/Thr protein kinase)
MANVCLRFSNRDECVAVVHEAVVGLARALSLDALATGDLDTAVAEAVKNAILHAYEGADGPVEVELHALDGRIEAVVRDRGIGIRPHLGERERTQPHTGIGLPIVHLLARRVVYTNMPGGGTEVSMEFPVEGLLAPGGSEAKLSEESARRLGDRVELSLAPLAIARSVLPRTLAALLVLAGFGAGAARGDDAGAAASAASAALAAAAAELDGSAGTLALGGEAGRGRLDLRVGPLAAAPGERLACAWREHLHGRADLSEHAGERGERTLALGWQPQQPA